jgi:hypothetical protein
MLTELFHEQSGRMHELEDELAKLKGQAGSSHPQFQLQTARAPRSSSPNFLHFVGLDRGRHPGLPWGVAGVTRRSTWTESLSI